jgi:adenylate cyclase
MIKTRIIEAKILIVDDNQTNITLLEVILRSAGYQSITTTLDSRTVCDLHAKNSYDLILLDLQMPNMDGFEVMEDLKIIEKDGYLPVLVITAQPDHKLRALKAGAKDFVSKPFDSAEVLTRVHNMLEVRLLHRDIVTKNDELKKLFDQVVAERRVSERLALQVPADSIAARLQARPDVSPDSFAGASVVIADIIGFSDLAHTTKPERLKLLLEEIFSTFDELVIERSLRKIKTLGNSYMAAGGVPPLADDHVLQAVQLSLDMLVVLDRFNTRNASALQVRVGVATGAVVAAVIGKRMYVYDVWGDAVNMACSMESHGVAGRVQVCDETRRRLGEAFPFEKGGVIETDGRGETNGWFVTKRNGTTG